MKIKTCLKDLRYYNLFIEFGSAFRLERRSLGKGARPQWGNLRLTGVSRGVLS